MGGRRVAGEVGDDGYTHCCRGQPGTGATSGMREYLYGIVGAQPPRNIRFIQPHQPVNLDLIIQLHLTTY